MTTFKWAHTNLNVLDLDKSLAFYKDLLGLNITRTKEADDGSFKLVYLGTDECSNILELTWLRDRTAPYNLGDNEIHIALTTKDYDAVHKKHKEMGLTLWENESMGIYFVQDPDGYWVEILPEKI